MEPCTICGKEGCDRTDLCGTAGSKIGDTIRVWRGEDRCLIQAKITEFVTRSGTHEVTGVKCSHETYSIHKVRKVA